MSKEELDEMLERVHWTKAKLARVLDVNPQCLYRFQSGRRKGRRMQKVLEFAITYVLS